MTDNNETNVYFLKKQRNDIRMEYNPDEYDAMELRLVYKHCGNLYSEYLMSKEKGLCTEAAKDDCRHFWDNKERLFKGKMSDLEYERLKNELSLIRLVLGV